MSNLRRVPEQMSVPIPPDEEGYLGRECPNAECLGYFKVKPGTGIEGVHLCYCPYCGHSGSHNVFWTQEQLEYAKSVALHQITGALLKDLKAMEFDTGSRGMLRISMKVEGRPHPIHYYREKQLETAVTCSQCTLQYTVYGVFAYCPDCGMHNSLQILLDSLEVVKKLVHLADTVESQLKAQLVGDALENAVSAFDGFGREICRRHASSSSAPDKAENVSFQNLETARRNVRTLFGMDLAAGVEVTEWSQAYVCFQKRHLLAHSMGVVDDKYLKDTQDQTAIKGRKVVITPDEVIALVSTLQTLGSFIAGQLLGFTTEQDS
jgi:ribosomal protein L44E